MVNRIEINKIPSGRVYGKNTLHTAYYSIYHLTVLRISILKENNQDFNWKVIK